MNATSMSTYDCAACGIDIQPNEMIYECEDTLNFCEEGHVIHANKDCVETAKEALLGCIYCESKISVIFNSPVTLGKFLTSKKASQVALKTSEVSNDRLSQNSAVKCFTCHKKIQPNEMVKKCRNTLAKDLCEEGHVIHAGRDCSEKLNHQIIDGNSDCIYCDSTVFGTFEELLLKQLLASDKASQDISDESSDDDIYN
jgi:hypothetical protein